MPCLCKVDQILDYIIIVSAARRRRINRRILGRYWQTECDGAPEGASCAGGPA